MDGTSVLDPPGLVGPNAVVQLAAALEEMIGQQEARSFFSYQGLESLFDTPPGEMIDQRIPARLMRALWDHFPDEMASTIASSAGRKTADYVIAHRIPWIAKASFHIVPRSVAASLLMNAIHRNAWTFAGSGICEVSRDPAHLISIRENPLALPNCAWHVAVFERLFRRLVHRDAKVRHLTCCRDTDKACQFVIDLS
ncbi:bacteriochlorophyll 4-vinyl reductase [Silicimonas sp. MF1-12-2]|uniref:bacteriochlorophyll 4-vinyl reductase n=1 Tax=Silicimonas sp. MF1-12-2 TaxID=3384793 RepID=UPI0039B545A7